MITLYKYIMLHTTVAWVVSWCDATQISNSYLLNKFVVANIGLEFSSYAYEAAFVILAQDNVVKNFTDFGLEWEIQFTVTILNEISSDLHNIMYIPGT